MSLFTCLFWVAKAVLEAFVFIAQQQNQSVIIYTTCDMIYCYLNMSLVIQQILFFNFFMEFNMEFQYAQIRS